MQIGRKGRAALGGLIIALLVGLPVAAWLAGRSSRTPEEAAALSAPPPAAVLTDVVERRALVRDYVLRGTVNSVGSVDIAAATGLAGAEPVVTAVLVKEGDDVVEGQPLLEVAGRPVFMFSGAFPAYRDLHVGDRGPDVSQVEAALDRLGFRPGRLDGLYDADLAAAIRRAWEQAGYQPLAVATEPTQNADGVQRPGPTYPILPKAEVSFVKASPMIVSDLRVTVGSVIDGSPLSLASKETVVTAEVPEADAHLITAGAVAVVDGPDGAPPRDGTVATVPQVSEESDGPPVATFAIAMAEPFDTNEVGLAVRITIRLEATEGEVLVVPLVAVSSSADGKAHVEVLDADRRSRNVAVLVGLTVDGYAEVTGELEVGDVVRIG